MGNAEKTEYDAQFENLSSRAERTKKLTENLVKQTEAMLQPHPGIYSFIIVFKTIIM